MSTIKQWKIKILEVTQTAYCGACGHKNPGARCGCCGTPGCIIYK